MAKKSKNIPLIEIIKLLLRNVHWILLSIIIFVGIGISINIATTEKMKLRGYAQIPINPFLETNKDKTRFIIEKMMKGAGLPFTSQLEVQNSEIQAFLTANLDKINLFETMIIKKKNLDFANIIFETNLSKKETIKEFSDLSTKLNINLAQAFNKKILLHIGAVADIYTFNNTFLYKLLSYFYYETHGISHKNYDGVKMDETTYINTMILKPHTYFGELKAFAANPQEQQKIFLDVIFQTTDRQQVMKNLIDQLSIDDNEINYNAAESVNVQFIKTNNTYKALYAYAILGLFFGIISIIIRKKI